MDQTPDVSLITPTLPEHMDVVRDIFREYAESLGVDLAFQDFEAELAALRQRSAAVEVATTVAVIGLAIRP